MDKQGKVKTTKLLLTSDQVQYLIEILTQEVNVSDAEDYNSEAENILSKLKKIKP